MKSALRHVFAGPIWAKIVVGIGIAVLALVLFSCVTPTDLNHDGKIDLKERTQPTASIVKDVAASVLPQAKGLIDQVYYWIYGGIAAGTLGGAGVAKLGSKKRHKKQEEAHEAELRKLRHEYDGTFARLIQRIEELEKKAA